MRRSAFSLIELIFVIMILGILASIVVAKMGNMTESAKKIRLKAMTGTLNRSVVAVIWHRSIIEDNSGSVRFSSYDNTMNEAISLIDGYESEPSLVNCNNDGNGTYLTYVYVKTYEIHCKDGSFTTAPTFRLYNLTDAKYID